MDRLFNTFYFTFICLCKVQLGCTGSRLDIFYCFFSMNNKYNLGLLNLEHLSLTPGRKWGPFPRLLRLRQSTAPCLAVRLVLDQSEMRSVVTWPGLLQSQLTSRCPPRICSACAGSRWSPCCCTAWGPSRGRSSISPVTISTQYLLYSQVTMI